MYSDDGFEERQYHIIKRFKKGVFLARDDRHAVVLKDTLEEYEVMALQALDHPGIIRLEDLVFDYDGKWVAVLEYAQGDDLYGRRMHEAAAVTLGAQLADALGHMHVRGFVYNDLSPFNIRQQEHRAKLIDLGACVPADVQFSDELLSTPGFHCIDQLHCVNAPSNDVFGLGAVLHYALCGERPYLCGPRLRTWRRMRLEQQNRYEQECLSNPPPRLPVGAPLASLLQGMLEQRGSDRPSMAEAGSLLSSYVAESLQ